MALGLNFCECEVGLLNSVNVLFFKNIINCLVFTYEFPETIFFETAVKSNSFKSKIITNRMSKLIFAIGCPVFSSVESCTTDVKWKEM